MATQVVMPQMGYDMTEGTVVKWIKNEGDAVKKGDVIAEIETDKATVEMEADAAGVLRRIVVGPGNKVPVGEVIAYIGSADEAIPDAPAAGPAKPVAAKEPPAPAPAPSAQAQPHEAPAPAVGELKVSPIARALADQHGIDLRHVKGTGPGGRITKEDVLEFAKAPKAPAATSDLKPATMAGPGATGETAVAAPKAAPAPSAAPAAKSMRVGLPARKPDANGRIPLNKMSQAIARRTAQTMREAPLFYLTVNIDMTRALDFRKELNEALGGDVRVSVNDMIMKACAIALQKHPVFNSIFKDDHLVVQPHMNIGMAVALPEGLVVPSVLECEHKSLVQIAREAKDVAERARSGTLKQEEYTGTFSVSNLGMFDVDEFTAIIVSPQVAVLAVGSVRPTPVVRDNAVAVRQMMQATLSTDHRAANGAESAQFAVEIKRVLENPLLLTM